MNFSTNYIIFLPNKALERAIANSIGMLSAEMAAAAAPDTKVAVADNFRYARGNYEQHRFSARIYESLREALEASLADTNGHGKCATPNDETYHDRFPNLNPLNETTSHSTKLPNAAAKSLVIPQAGEEANESLREFHVNDAGELAAKISRAREPLVWTETQNNLGNILAALGQQRRDAALFERAIRCFGKALEELSQEGSPLEWAATQYNLGTANQALGRLLETTQPLKIAVDAYTNALLVWTREKSPEDWMFTMHQLGATLHTFGKLLKGNRQFQKSVVAYKNALAALDADDYALELVATHNNRAAALHHLGESEENPDRLKEALNSYELALTVSMEQQLPIHVAVICRVNKATAQNALAQLTNDAALAEEIADEFEVIMECFPHALQPLCLKHCEEQRKKAQAQLTALNSQTAG